MQNSFNDDDYIAPYVAVKGKYIAMKNWKQTGGDIDKYMIFYNENEHNRCADLAGGGKDVRFTESSGPSIDTLRSVLGRSAYFVKLPNSSSSVSVTAKQVVDSGSLLEQLKNVAIKL